MSGRRAALKALAALGAAAALRRAGAQTAALPRAGALASPAAQAAFTPFEFVALGDMPYGPDLIRGGAYRHLIDLINALAPPFAIHIGDFKDGLAACSDDEYTLQFNHFQRFAKGLVYTPGDNDWLDCSRRGDDPLERLAALRQRFFPPGHSLGQHPLAVQRQGDLMPAHAAYIENLRWAHQGVLLASFHTLGPDDGSTAPSAAVRAERVAREAANAAWISAAFSQARRTGARALVLATQAEVLSYRDSTDPTRGTVKPAFAASITQTLLPLAAAAPFPVLLIHGDVHRHIIDRPFRTPQGQLILNLWRLQVFGEPRMHAVRVQVNPPVIGDARPFSFTTLWNPLSPDPRTPGRIER